MCVAPERLDRVLERLACLLIARLRITGSMFLDSGHGYELEKQRRQASEPNAVKQ